MKNERGIDAFIETIVLLPFFILMFPLIIWGEVRNRRLQRKKQ